MAKASTLRRFEEMVGGKIRCNVLTDGNIRALVKVVDEQMNGVATEQAGVTFMVAQQLRHVPRYMALRRRIQAGELGQIWSARCDTFLAAALTDNLASGRPRQGWWGFDGKRGGGGVVDVTVPGVGRNDDCPCGSGKKYQRCHDATATRDRRIVDRMQRD